MLTQDDLMTHDVRIVVHHFSRCVHSLSTVVIFQQFQSICYMLVQCTFKEQYLSFSKYHLPIDAAHRVDGASHKFSANKSYYAKIFREQKIVL